MEARTYLRLPTGSCPKSSFERSCGGNCYSLKRIAVAYFTIPYLIRKALFHGEGDFIPFCTLQALQSFHTFYKIYTATIYRWLFDLLRFALWIWNNLRDPGSAYP